LKRTEIAPGVWEVYKEKEVQDERS